ncbi:helix-turn-helix domain-containing protein [soil metagenome]
MDATTRTDPVDRAHLTGRNAPSPTVHRYGPSPDLADLVRSFWVPCWDLPAGVTQVQRVLQHPVCLIVVAHDYARFYGVVTGLSTVELAGRGYAVGVMLQPAAGRLLLGRSVASVTDRHVPLETVPTLDGGALRDRVRAVMVEAPRDRAAHAAAIAELEQALRPHAVIDDEGRRINDIVARVEEDRDIRTVTDLAAAEAVSERALQRLTRDRLGLTPRWLIRRRRLHDAVEQIKSGAVRLADLAADLGYTDQAHLTHDFQRATGTTPGAYLAQQQGVGQATAGP